VLKNPANRHRAVGFTYDQWRYAFTNTFDEADARAGLRSLSRPGIRGHFLGQRAGEFHPGPQDVAVDYKNDARATLLFISGSEDHRFLAARQNLSR
jgi:hypothetical protein